VTIISIERKTMVSLCIVELYVTVNNIKIINVLQKYFYGEFISPETIKNLFKCSCKVPDIFLRF